MSRIKYKAGGVSILSETFIIPYTFLTEETRFPLPKIFLLSQLNTVAIFPISITLFNNTDQVINELYFGTPVNKFTEPMGLARYSVITPAFYNLFGTNSSPYDYHGSLADPFNIYWSSATATEGALTGILYYSTLPLSIFTV